MNNSISHHVVVIVGGGTAGLTVATLLKAARADLDIAAIKPSEPYYYQPDTYTACYQRLFD